MKEAPLLSGLLAAFLGGGVGSALRYGLGRVLWGATLSVFGGLSVGTVGANVLGSLVLGALSAWLPTTEIKPFVRILLTTGLCGGFTTYSTFNQEFLRLVDDAHLGNAALYILTTILVCAAAGAAGYFGLRSVL